MYDEGPSQEDIDRFSESETGYCPHCGNELWDDASQCPSCKSWLSEGTSLRDPVSNSFQKRFIVVIVVVVLFAFLWEFKRFIF